MNPQRKAEVSANSSQSRRDFLKRGSGSIALSMVLGFGFAEFVPTAEGAPRTLPVKVLNQQEARILLAIARTLFPHDFLADDYYINVVAAIDDKTSCDAKTASMLREGLTRLGKKFRLLSELEREKMLRAIEKSPFFIFVHGETLNHLYANPEVWKIFGYEGSSVDLSSFDDIDWLPND